VSQDITLYSPAKANLFFHVLNKRSDGYHAIESLVQVFSLFDTLSISLTDEISSFSSNVDYLTFDSSNLIYRAIELFKLKTHLKFHVKVRLDKKIPIKSGLGGGSSNAATTLWGLNKLLSTSFSSNELAQMGKELGADVPLFFGPGRVFCQGIGEKLTPVSYESKSYYLACPKNLSLSTPEVFKNLNLENRPFPQDKINYYNPLTINHLESSAFNLCPALFELKQSLYALGFQKVMMTGSGSCFICSSNLKNPFLLGVDFYHVLPLLREEKSWYYLDSF
jgi:4-diphosphocytidyl-2-C-methyl-D-erythritol kinase